MKLKFLLFLLLFNVPLTVFSAKDTKKILILVEGNYDLKSQATAEGREMANLLGHFKTLVDIRGVNTYLHQDMAQFDAVFYIGFDQHATIPTVLAQDILKANKTIVWINTGISDFSNNFGMSAKFGFKIIGYQEHSVYDHVISDEKIFTKGTAAINLIKVVDANKVQIIARAFNDKSKKETPYIVRSGNFWYVADSPFRLADETDRYLLFADLLHEILNEKHPALHSAIIRIEDINPNSSPEQVRDMAECLANRNIPFLIGVSPFYINPTEGTRFSLSERPDMVDALKYAVEKGGTIVMHGTTHQYRGLTGDDCEFWDALSAKPISDETEENISSKIETGINEFMKNGLYPLLWETPHYTASILSYNIIAKYFSTACEQVIAMDDKEEGQYFPYIIYKSIYGQKIYPENLGYVPMSPIIDTERVYINKILKNAQMIHSSVRDGIASFYYHSFLRTDLLEELVDGIKDMGFEFVDLRNVTNSVHCSDKVIISGSQTFDINLSDTYLNEAYFDRKGDNVKQVISSTRLKGKITKTIDLLPGYFYKAEPVDFKVKELTFKEKVENEIKTINRSLFESEQTWKEARVGLFWLKSPRGAASNDQLSFAAALKTVNIFVDTLFLNSTYNLSNYNLLVIPYAVADSITDDQLKIFTQFVKHGGSLITDRRNKLVDALGFEFTKTQINVRNVRNMFYISEQILWKYPALTYKIELSSDDEILCEDVGSKSAVAIGRMVGKGRVIYFNTPFDPNSTLGYSRYPYLIDYIKSYFNLMPVVKRDNLEFYFDPGFRQNTSIEISIKLWVRNGIHIVHVAGWHEYPKYKYDYARLIRLAHANGILVYAWIEPPQVSQKFWLDHPQWREMNYKGVDVRPSWRYPMALTDDSCLKAMMKAYSTLLNSYDWDGVNLGELYFESNNGLKDPNMFTPMHPSAEKEVFQKYGFHIQDLFHRYSGYFWEDNDEYTQDLIKYRLDKILNLHEFFLKNIYQISQKKKGFQIIVTVMDSYGSPELKEGYGVNIEKIIELQKKYGFMLQVEDPQNKWSTSPLRYQSMGDFYAGKMDRNKLMLDLNILKFRTIENITPFPTLTQTGTESFHLIHSSALGAPRFTVYSEASVNPQDIPYFSYASASVVNCKTTLHGYSVTSSFSFELKLPNNIHVIYIDGQPLEGIRDNIYLIPAGEHEIVTDKQDISGFSTLALQPMIVSFTGNLLSFKYDIQKVMLSYESEGRALLALDRTVSNILVDEQPYHYDIMKGNDCISVFLPKGKHTITIITGNKLSFGINITSLWSTMAIVIFGVLAVALLLLLYIILKIIRRHAD